MIEIQKTRDQDTTVRMWGKSGSIRRLLMIVSHFHISVLAGLILVSSTGSYLIKLNHLETQGKNCHTQSREQKIRGRRWLL